MTPHFTDSELHHIRDILTEHFHKEVDIQLADCDLALKQHGKEVVTCPTVLWHEDNTNFVVFKVGMFRFRSQFFYTPHEQYSTDTEEYNELGKCVVEILAAQSCHTRNEHQNHSNEPANSNGIA